MTGKVKRTSNQQGARPDTREGIGTLQLKPKYH